MRPSSWFFLIGALGISVPLLTPRIGALAIRLAFDRHADALTKKLLRHAPKDGVRKFENLVYSESGLMMNVYAPFSAEKRVPILFWIHGGGWVSGNRNYYAPYYELLAKEGFVVVTMDYSLSPKHRFPQALLDLGDAYGYLATHADTLHADPKRVILAGDSAGANLAAQIAALASHPTYAKEIAIPPPIDRGSLVGMILHCGLYDLTRVVNDIRGQNLFTRETARDLAWAYTGSTDLKNPDLRKISPYLYLTADFPPTFVSGGNGDFLTVDQSLPFAKKLADLGVNTETFFFDPGYSPALLHEYQFDLDLKDAQTAFEREVSFARKLLSPVPANASRARDSSH